MSKSCKPLHPGLFCWSATTAALVFAAPQTCAEAFRQGLALCGGSLLVSLFPFLVVSALIMRSGAGEVLGVLALAGGALYRSAQPQRGQCAARRSCGRLCPCRRRCCRGSPQQGADPAGSFSSVACLHLLRAVFCHFDGRGAAAGQPHSQDMPVCRTGAGGLADSGTALPCLRHTGAFARAARCRTNSTAAGAGCHPCAGGSDLPEIMRLCAVFSPAGGRLWAAAARGACALSGHALLEVCSGCDYAARTGLWASGLCCAALSVQGASVLLQVRTLCPPEVSFKPLLWGRVLHLPLSLALFYLGLPQSAVESFNTLCARVVPMRRVPTDCALLVFAVSLHHGLRGLPPDHEEGTKRSSGKQKPLSGLQTAAKCGNITLGYHITKRSDGESRRCLHGKERSFTG